MDNHGLSMYNQDNSSDDESESTFLSWLAWMGKGNHTAAESSMAQKDLSLVFKFVRDMPQVFCFVGNANRVTSHYGSSSKKRKAPPVTLAVANRLIITR